MRIRASTRKAKTPSHPADVSDITILDARVLGALLFQNTRTGLDNPTTQRKMPELSHSTSTKTCPAGGDGLRALHRDRRLRERLRAPAHLGTLRILDDGSARVVIPGGVPIVLRGVFALDGAGRRTTFQREEMQFYPANTRTSLSAGFFDGFCGGATARSAGTKSTSRCNRTS